MGNLWRDVARSKSGTKPTEGCCCAAAILGVKKKYSGILHLKQIQTHKGLIRPPSQHFQMSRLPVEA